MALTAEQRRRRRQRQQQNPGAPQGSNRAPGSGGTRAPGKGGYTPGKGDPIAGQKPFGPKAKQRARRRYKAIGGVKGVNIKDGVNRREGKKIRRKWIRKGKPRPWKKNGNNNNGNQNGAGKGDESGTGLSKEQERMIRTITRGEFAADERSINEDIQREVNHQGTIGEAFKSYRGRVDQILQQHMADAAQSQAAFGAGTAQMAGAQAGVSAEANADIDKRSQALGFGPGGTTVAQGMAEQNAITQATSAGASQKYLSDTNLLAGGALRATAALAPREEIAQREKSGQRRHEAELDKRTLLKEKRGFRSKMRSEEKQRQMEQYVAMLSVQQKAMSDKEDRALRLRLGLIDARQAAAERRAEAKDNAADRASEEAMNADDNATSRANDANDGDGGGGGGGSSPSGGLSPSEAKEWRQKKAKYNALASTYRKYRKQGLSQKGAWTAAAQAHGGRLTHMDLVAMTQIASGKPLKKNARQYLNGEFPGGKSPWS